MGGWFVELIRSGRIVSMLRFLFLLLLFGCGDDPYDGRDEGGNCTPVAGVRCMHNRYQICSSEEIWETVYDCSEHGLACDLNEVCAEPDGGVDAG